ncbi:MAG: EAL domain-containing protein [Gammaproteobacteria bacterium]|nr:EAL domain-containing protein [Gammaproteobacteria bacterium]
MHIGGERKIFSPVSLRLVVYIVLCSSFLTIILTAFQLYRDYRADIASTDMAFDQIKKVHVATISESLWGFDRKQLETIVRGMSNLRDLKYIEVIEGEELLLALGDASGTADNLRRLPLLYNGGDGFQEIGQLNVAFNLMAIRQRLLERALVIVVSNTIKTALVVVFMIIIFRLLIARHLDQISKYLVDLKIGKPYKPLRLNRQRASTTSSDELDLVADSINRFMMDNESYLIKLKHSQEELRTQGQIISNMLEGAFLASMSDGTILYTNPAFDNMFGYDHREVTGQNISILSTSDEIDSDDFIGKMRVGLSNKGIWQGEISNVRKDGVSFWSAVNAATFHHAAYGKVAVVVLSDITERKALDTKLNYLASHDTLTGLLGRYEFEKRVTRLLSTTFTEHTEHAMCFIDLDQFKIINDTCGHAAGDELLCQLGKLLQGIIGEHDTLARLGGDEFGVLMEHCMLARSKNMVDDILKAIEGYQFFWQGKMFRVGASIGLVAITEFSGNITEVFKQADAACYLAKDLGRNRMHIYHPDDTELAIRHGEMQWVGYINHALDDNRFCLYAQPIVSLSGDGQGYELLIRMLDERGNTILPSTFLPAAERYNLIERLDAWVVDHAGSIMAEHPKFFEQADFISINLSGSSLTNLSLLELILSSFGKSEVMHSKVCFEVTETVAVSNLGSAINFINELREYGFKFSLDDFGSGISSFGYLKNLPVDYLKIDGMFVKDIVSDPIDYAMVKSINEIGQVMGMQTIAEFIENDKVREMLVAIGVNYGQGYGLGKPEPLQDLIAKSGVALVS